MIDQVEDSGKGQVKAVGFDTPPDEQTITRSYPKHFDKFVPMQVFSFTFSGNSANIDTTLPEILQPFQKTIPHPLDKMMKLPSTPLFQGKELRAEEFGIIANTKQDDTAELKQLFAAAAKKPGATVILPGRRLKLTETLEIPKYIKVTAYGTAKLLMKDAQKDIFRINDPECVELSHLIFEGGRHFLNITSQPEKRGLVSIENCNGFSCSQAAIRAFSGNKQIRENNFLQLVICNGFWYVNRFYEGGANAYLDSIWLQSKRLNPISSTWIPPESVVIVNFGKLQLTSMLGVPLVLPKNSIVRPPGSAIGDHRWIDNHGELYCFNNRFGGERGGYCSIYHYGPAKTRIYGGYAWFNNDSSYKIPVLADTSNADVRAINLVCSPYPTEPIALRWRNPDGAIVNTTRQELYNIIPDTTIKPDDRNPREK